LQVKGASITAAEIFQAKIIADGTVNVASGVAGANIQAKGNVSAKYVKSAVIYAYGDVFVTKEALSSKIVTGSNFRAPTAKIISCKISARNIVDILQVGTEVSDPCVIKLGGDEHTEKEIAGIVEQIQEKKENLSKATTKKKKIKKEIAQRHDAIADLAQIEDRTGLDINNKTQQLKEAEEHQDEEKMAQLRQSLDQLEEKRKSASESLEIVFDKQDETEAILKKIKEYISRINEEIIELTEEQDAILKWADKQKKKAVIKIRGTAYEGTVFEGEHSSLKLPKTMKNIVVRERKISSPDEPDKWEMRAKPAK